MTPMATPTPIPALVLVDRPPEIAVAVLGDVEDSEDVGVIVTVDVKYKKVGVDAKSVDWYLTLMAYALTQNVSTEVVVTSPVPGSLVV